MESIHLEHRALIRPIVITAGIIGSIQGLLWTIIALISILYYYGCIVGIGDSIYGNFIYHYFLDGNSEPLPDFLLPPKNFNILMYFYSILSLVWLALSLYLLWAMIRQKWANLPLILTCWAVTTLSIALMDAVSVGLVAADYSRLQNLTNLLMTYVIVMSAFARGYVLWIVNVIFGIILARFSYQLSRKKEPIRRSFINGYGPSAHALNLYEETDIGNGNVNTCFQPDDDLIFGDTSLEKENSSKNLPSNDYPSFLHRYQMELHENNDKLAKIGKANLRSRTPPLQVPPPNIPHSYEMKANGIFLPRLIYNNPPVQKVKQQNINPNMPYIPEPDYTPPVSPKLLPKSALRPKSNYILY